MIDLPNAWADCVSHEKHIHYHPVRIRSSDYVFGGGLELSLYIIICLSHRWHTFINLECFCLFSRSCYRSCHEHQDFLLCTLNSVASVLLFVWYLWPILDLYSLSQLSQLVSVCLISICLLRQILLPITRPHRSQLYSQI